MSVPRKSVLRRTFDTAVKVGKAWVKSSGTFYPGLFYRVPGRKPTVVMLVGHGTPELVDKIQEYVRKNPKMSCWALAIDGRERGGRRKRHLMVMARDRAGRKLSIFIPYTKTSKRVRFGRAEVGEDFGGAFDIPIVQQASAEPVKKPWPGFRLFVPRHKYRKWFALGALVIGAKGFLFGGIPGWLLMSAFYFVVWELIFAFINRKHFNQVPPT